MQGYHRAKSKEKVCEQSVDETRYKLPQVLMWQSHTKCSVPPIISHNTQLIEVQELLGIRHK